MSTAIRLAQKVVYLYYKKRFACLGDGTKINPTAFIEKKKNISIGRHSFVGKQCHISVADPATLVIGDYVGISPYVKILAGDRNLSVVGKHFMEVIDGQNKSIRIEQDVMVGIEAMILKGVTLGEGAVIGAKALVTKDVLPFSIAVGNPARMVKLRFAIDDIQAHMIGISSRHDFDELLSRYKGAGLVR